MRYFENTLQHDPQMNLALEEFLLRHRFIDEPVLLFYVNDPSIIVGRNQNVFEEINFTAVRRQKIPVLRRLSGGGTVYHDAGNLNFSLLTPDQKLLNDFTAFTRPVIDALRGLGLSADLRNRSSIYVGDRKVSGNAQYATTGRLVSHGTLLVHSDLAQLREVIRPARQQVKSRAVQSVRSSVANINDLLGSAVTLDEVKDQIKRAFVGSDAAVPLQLDDNDWKAVRQIAYERYRSWSWNIGRSPKFTTIRRVDTQLGEVVLELLVEKGHIQACRPLENDPRIDLFLLSLSDCLQGVRYDHDEIIAALLHCDVAAFPPGVHEEQIVELLF
ncbi:MAG: lipoate--protein ligase [Candidatus Promineifilaceae bacterium]